MTGPIQGENTALSGASGGREEGKYRKHSGLLEVFLLRLAGRDYLKSKVGLVA